MSNFTLSLTSGYVPIWTRKRSDTSSYRPDMPVDAAAKWALMQLRVDEEPMKKHHYGTDVWFGRNLFRFDFLFWPDQKDEGLALSMCVITPIMKKMEDEQFHKILSDVMNFFWPEAISFPANQEAYYDEWDTTQFDQDPDGDVKNEREEAEQLEPHELSDSDSDHDWPNVNPSRSEYRSGIDLDFICVRTNNCWTMNTLFDRDDYYYSAAFPTNVWLLRDTQDLKKLASSSLPTEKDLLKLKLHPVEQVLTELKLQADELDKLTRPQ